MFGLGGIDLLASTGLATANTYKTHCCEQVRHAAAVQNSIITRSRSIQVELGKVEGF